MRSLPSDLQMILNKNNITFMGSHFEQRREYITPLTLKCTHKNPKPKHVEKYITSVVDFFDEQWNRLVAIDNNSQLPSDYVFNEIAKLLNVGKSIKEVETHFINESAMNGIHAEFLELTQSKDYPDVFPHARKTPRKIIAYLGDTNSGKTYRALQELSKSTNSAYTAPLRLLALENFNTLNGNGIPTSLITGEEKKIVDGAECVASTVECFSTDNQYETVVIDEIQLIDDPQRGPFFVQALVGANADTVIVTGPREYARRLQQIADYLGEELVIEEFTRKSELKAKNKPTRLEDIKPKTALVGFSRRDLYTLQRQLPKHLSSTLLYGSLGCEVRKAQAERFTNGEVDVIITTDCIGMGLNLPIEHVVFSKVQKYDGEAVTDISGMLVKQLAGRAGRYGQFDVGYYSGIDKNTHTFVKHKMEKKLKPNLKQPLAVLPPESYVRLLSEGYRLSHILEAWADKLNFDENSLFVTTGLENQILIAKFIEKSYPVDVKTFWRLIYCPIDFHKQYHEFTEVVDQLIGDGFISVPDIDPRYIGQNDLECFIRDISMYKWFFKHYPRSFNDDTGMVLDDLTNKLNKELNRRLQKS